MIIGIMGLPQSGKTTLFNALCGTHQATGGYTAKGEIHRGVVKVPDTRLLTLAQIFRPEKVSYAEIEWMDVSGFTGDKSDRNRVDTEIPTAVREADALAHIVRYFEDPNVPHPKGTVDPERDIRLIEQELIFADLVLAEKRIERIARQIKVAPDENLRREKAVLDECLEQLNREMPLRDMELSSDEEKVIRGFQFLSIKPKLIILNIDEKLLPERRNIQQRFSGLADTRLVAVETISSKVQMELAELDEVDRQEFMKELGIAGFALDRVITSSYQLLGLVSFLTGNEREVHAWAVRKGTHALAAAGTIHKDFEKGFIKAEVIPFQKLAEAKSEAEAKRRGWMRLEGKEYVVQDGDVILFRFNI